MEATMSHADIREHLLRSLARQPFKTNFVDGLTDDELEMLAEIFECPGCGRIVPQVQMTYDEDGVVDFTGFCRTCHHAWSGSM